MQGDATAKTDGKLWFVYDGQCPLCNHAAHALRIRRDVGELVLLDARSDPSHPLLMEIREQGLDLDEGMVLKYRGRLYHGRDVLHMMALLGSGQGWFNRMNAVLFRYPALARACYPVMRFGRNTMLRFKNVDQIRNLTQVSDMPLFQTVLGKAWHQLPPVMKNHYAIRPFSTDRVTVRGTLDVTVSPMVSLMARLTGMLVAHNGKDVPVTVVFTSDQSGAFRFDRTFAFPGKGEVVFKSSMLHIHDNVMVEFMRFGIGWKCAFQWDGEKMILHHKGYVWRILGFLVPLPMALVIGRGHAEEVPLSDDEFSMWTHSSHFLFGKTFGYAGKFKVTEVTCDPS